MRARNRVFKVRSGSLALVVSLCGIAGTSAAVASSVAEEEPQGPFSRRTPVVVAVERVGPAVVNIATEKIVERQLPPWLWGSFEPQYLRALSLGSGVLVDPRGYVVTNAHVTSRASKIQVHLRDGRKISARLVAVDTAEDTALLRLEEEGSYPYVDLGRTDDMLIGETVIALGNPFGLENSVSTGVVSAKNRSIEADGRAVFQDLIQTDASINPGNSGGPLLNINGELVGISTAIKAGAQGIGFAIPAEKVLDTLLRITTPDRIGHANVGMSLGRPEWGAKAVAVVTGVEPRGPAARAGIQLGDRVYAVGADETDLPARNALGLTLSLLERSKGERLRFSIRRQAGVHEAMLTVGRSAGPPWWRFGIDLGEDADDGNALPRVRGIEVSGPAAEAGIREGDVVFNLGSVPVQSAREFESLLPQLDSGTQVEVGIERGRRRYLTTLIVR